MLIIVVWCAQILPSANPQHTFGMAIYGDYLFWTDWVMQAVMRCNKYTGEELVKLRSAPRPMGIIAVSNSSSACEYFVNFFFGLLFFVF